MNTSQQDEPTRAPLTAGVPPSLNLSQLLALARAHSIDEQHLALEQVKSGAASVAEPIGDPYLLFTCADVACAASLTSFREVLPTLPTTVALPFSPPWMLGFFAQHTDLIGLVDPAPFVFESPGLSSVSRARAHNGRVIIPGRASAAGETWRLSVPESGPTALIVGTSERMLALAVSSVGDVAYVQPEEMSDDAGVATSARMPAERFRAGVYVQPNSQSAFYLLKIDVLLDTLLEALMSAEGAAHE